MGSSAKQEKKFFKGHWSDFWIKMAFGIGHPPPTHQLQSTCMGEGQGSQIFKQNSIILIHSKSMAFLVISLSPWSPHCPRPPHIVPIAPRRSPCGPHGCGLHGLYPMLSPWSPCHPHVIPVLSPVHPHSPQKVPMWSPWLWLPWSPPHIVPVIPTSSLTPQIPTPLGGVGAPNQ